MECWNTGILGNKKVKPVASVFIADVGKYH
jgi:hypothetical protein